MLHIIRYLLPSEMFRRLVWPVRKLRLKSRDPFLYK
jgi:hypothetical protein